MIRQKIGQYQILEQIGTGGMGAVYRGIDRMLEREVAIKMLRPELARDHQLVKRFRTEAVTLARLNHPHIATLYSFFREDEDFFMVMEFVPGQTLEDVLIQSGALPLERARSIFDQALQGIEHAHRHGIIHRDIKPSNIVLAREGTVKVMDFGIARVLGTARMTQTGRLIGTLEYMAPEQVQGREGDARSDIYALGVLLYEMLTGRVPFEADSDYALMQAQIEQPPPPPRTLLPDLPAAVEAVILRALAKDPEERFQTASALRDAIKTAVPPPTEPSVPPPTRQADAAADNASLAPPHSTRQASLPDAPARTRIAALSAAVTQQLPGLLRTPKYLAGAVGLVLMLVFGVWVFGSPPPDDPPSDPSAPDNQPSNPSSSSPLAIRGSTFPQRPSVPDVSDNPDLDDLGDAFSEPADPIRQWLDLAQQYFNENKLTTPLGENAYELCQRVLEHNADNAEAQALIDRIAQQYATWGDARMARDDPEQALVYYEKSLAVRPNPEVARKRDTAEALLAEQGTSTVQPDRPPSVSQHPSPRQIVSLPAGTEIRVRLMHTLDSGEGYRKDAVIEFEVFEDVTLNGHVVIRKHARAVGTIVDEREARLIRRGELRFVLQSAEAVDGRPVPLRSETFGLEGARGQNVVIEQGTVYLAHVARSTPVGLR